MADLPKHKKLIPISKAAQVLNVSIDTIRRWDREGRLHAKRPNGKTRYFWLSQIEKIKSEQPLSVGQASKKLGISSSTLRRLDSKGLIRSERNRIGQRVYTKENLKGLQYLRGQGGSVFLGQVIEDLSPHLPIFKRTFLQIGIVILALAALAILLTIILAIFFLLFPEGTAKIFGKT